MTLLLACVSLGLQVRMDRTVVTVSEMRKSDGKFSLLHIFVYSQSSLPVAHRRQ